MPGNGAVDASYGDLLVTSLLVLGAVCVAAFLVVRVAGRLLAAGRARGVGLLGVVARLPLEPRRSLYVVEVAGKTLLVGTSEMGLSVLTELDGSAVRARVVERPSFGDLVRAAWQRRAAGASSIAHEPMPEPASPTGADDPPERDIAALPDQVEPGGGRPLSGGRTPRAGGDERGVDASPYHAEPGAGRSLSGGRTPRAGGDDGPGAVRRDEAP